MNLSLFMVISGMLPWWCEIRSRLRQGFYIGDRPDATPCVCLTSVLTWSALCSLMQLSHIYSRAGHTLLGRLWWEQNNCLTAAAQQPEHVRDRPGGIKLLYFICSWKLPSSSSLSASSRTNSLMLVVDNMPSSMSCLIRPASTTRKHSYFLISVTSNVSILMSAWLLTRWAHSYVALLQMKLVLTHGPAPDEHVALQALHGTAYCHHHRVDLHCYLSCRSQNKNLQEREINAPLWES